MDKRDQILEAIAAQERLRGTLDDQIIDATLAALQNQLNELDNSVIQQRKQITLLFMDIVGSSKIGLNLDPEDTMEIMDGAMMFLGEPIEKYGGRITRFMGDGFKAVFGAPVAQENDPEMAVKAGLEILESAKDFSRQLKINWGIENFQVRVGINTGLVALGGKTEAEDTLMGSTVNLAARMESSAPPGNLMISQNTFQHVRGLFDVEPHEPIIVKGFDKPVSVFLVRRVKPRVLRKQAKGIEGIETPMVGRETELQLLQDALYTALEEREGQVITITGEAGVGKSRLLAEFQEWIGSLPKPVQIFQGNSSLETQNVPYGLLRDLFINQFHVPDSPQIRTAQEKVEHGLNQVFGFDQQGEMRSHIVEQMLGFDQSASPHLKGLDDAQQLRKRAFNYLAEYFQAVSKNGPTVIILEDIHWGDDSSLDIIDQLGREIPQQALVIICLTRERLFERRPYWGEGETFHTRLQLKPLSNRQSRNLVEEILKNLPEIPLQLRELVIQGSEGNPYYIEELIKMLIADGVINTSDEIWQVESERLVDIHIPPTLMGVLQARLDGLPAEEKNTLQEASVIGRNFWDQAIAHIKATTSGEAIDPQEIATNLKSLRSREMVFRRESSEFSGSHEYTFKHSVLRDVAYESVPKKNRKVYHGLFADWLIEISDQRMGEYTGLIAEHLELGGEQERALPFLRQAGDLAAKHYANEEAIAYYNRALALFTLPMESGDTEQDQLQTIHESLGNVYAVIGQQSKARIEFQQAIEIIPKDDFLSLSRLQRKIGSAWQEDGEYEQSERAFFAAETILGPVTVERSVPWWQEWIWIRIDRLLGYYARAESEKIVALVEEIQPAVEEYGTPLQHAAYYSGQARMYFRRDRYTVTSELLEVSHKILSISEEIGDKQRLCDAHFELGFTNLWYGDLVQAEEHLQKSLTLSEQCSNLYSQTLCYTYLTIIYRKQRNFQRTQEYVNHSIRTATNRNLVTYLATARANMAWLALHSGNNDQAEALGKEALELWGQVPFVYPFQWTALWPLIAVMLEKEDYDQAVKYAQGLHIPVKPNCQVAR